MGLLNTGPLSMNNWTFTLLNTEVFSLRRFSLDQMRVPNFFSLFGRDLEDVPAPEEVLDLLAKSPFVLKGLSFQDITVQPPYEEESLSLGGLNLDFSLIPTEISFALSLDGFSCPASWLYAATELSMLIPEDLLEGSLLLSSKLDGALKEEGGEMNLAFSSAAEAKDLGGVSLSADLSLGKAANFLELADQEDIRARSLSFTLRDSGFLKTLAEYLLPQFQMGDQAGKFTKPEDVLRQLTQELNASIKDDPISDIFPSLGPAVTAFLEHSGSLAFTLRADPPLPMEDLDSSPDFQDLQAKGVTLTLEHKP
jgi:hypothetical protein